MAKQAQAGPVYFPWNSGDYDEIFVFAFAGILGAIIGATIIKHYRAKVK
jgi:uncharacterized membrane protein YfcA